VRTKTKFTAQVKGRVHTEGRNVVIPIALDNEPDRPTEVRIPRSKVVPILRAAVNAAESIEELNGDRKRVTDPQGNGNAKHVRFSG
jgi:hypothetical protein